MLKRREVLAGSIVSATVVASGFPAPALADTSPIKIGYLPALTGPSSSTGIGINRGTVMAVEEINNSGGINGRKIELIVRDTQSDPTKAVNAVAELTQRQKVATVWGPLNSGEALAATPMIARDKVPMLHPCWVDSLIDVKKYPMAFRIAPTNTQVGKGANHYVVNVLKLKKVAVISDTTGYGTASVETYVPMLKSMGPTPISSPSCCACRTAERRPSCRGASMPASCRAS
jgi:branched-chain amino acid transport system substrate-binding protein